MARGNHNDNHEVCSSMAWPLERCIPDTGEELTEPGKWLMERAAHRALMREANTYPELYHSRAAAMLCNGSGFEALVRVFQNIEATK